jgi:mRNA-degrading endonuclease toxin of MazEF toxin-antitoxin module
VLDEYLELGDPFDAHPLNGERRKAMTDQITTASNHRPLRHLGTLGAEDLAAVRRVVRLQLGL